MEALLWCLKPKGEIPYSLSSGKQTVHVIYCERTAGLYKAHPPFFYYILSWSNCKPTRECLAIINSCSWKRTRSHNCTFYNVRPGHCPTSVAVNVPSSWKHHNPGSWLKSEPEGLSRGGERSENNLLVIKLLRSFRPLHFGWLLSEYVTTLYISTKLNLNLQN